MTRRMKIWFGVATFIALANAVGAVFAGVALEPIHAGIHVAIALASAYAAHRIRSRAPKPTAQLASAFDEHLTRLEQSVDAVAVEVERIGERQRLMTQLVADKAQPRPANRVVSDPAATDENR